MQFQNAVITPSGIAIFSAANANKPIKFTRFLFTDSTTRLTGQETELPANTWGNGSVDAVVGRDELRQFVIYASASNADDYGYARGYGIYAVQDNVEYLVAVANCLGEPTYVSQRSGGYTRFHLALTIKYNVNSSVITVKPNMAGLISRAEFEMWTERVVTTHSPSGAPYGEDQDVYGRKYFNDGIRVGDMSGRYPDPSPLQVIGSIIIPNLPSIGSVTHTIGTSTRWFDSIYVDSIHTNWLSFKQVMTFNANPFANEPRDTLISIPANPSSEFRPIRQGIYFEVHPSNTQEFDTGKIPLEYFKRVRFALPLNSSYLGDNVLIRLSVYGFSNGLERRCANIYELSMAMARWDDVNGVAVVEIQNWSNNEETRFCVDLSKPHRMFLELERLR